MASSLAKSFGIFAAYTILTGTAVASPGALHCGRAQSPDGSFEASFTIQPGRNVERTMTVFVCDRMFRCHHAFLASENAQTSIEWAPNSSLIIRSTLAGTSEPPPEEAPAWASIRVETVPTNAAASPGTQLVFRASACRRHPPIASSRR